MTEKELTIAVKLSCQTALLGTITPNIRLITIGWEGLSNFYLKAYYDNHPSEEDYEEMDAVITEIISAVPFEKCQNPECLYDTRPRYQLEIYKWIVYSRKE